MRKARRRLRTKLTRIHTCSFRQVLNTCDLVKILFNIIVVMLNNEDLWEKSREIAQMLHTYVLGDKKSNMTRRNQVNKILETNSRMIFLNELQQIIPQIPDIKFAEDIGKLIHSMPVDNIPYFLTLVRFNYAIVCNQ